MLPYTRTPRWLLTLAPSELVMRASTDAARGLAFPRGFHRLLRRQVPGMIEIEIGNVARQLFGIGEARAIVFGGVARDVAGLLDGFGDGARREVRGAGGALALAEIHRDAHAAIALVFDRLDFARGEPWSSGLSAG